MTIHEKLVNQTSKKDQRIARARVKDAEEYPFRTYADIFDAYERPSKDKIAAWERCQRLCSELDGFDICILARNTMQFSVVFKFNDDLTGQLGYAYVTKDYDRFCWA